MFFESLGIKYHYEYQDFLLPSGVRYLPDFYLPDFVGGCYCEVKPLFDERSISKCIELYEATSQTVVLLEGVPDFKCQRVVAEWDERVYLENVLFCADQAEGEDRFFWAPGYEERDLTISEINRDCLGWSYTNAVNESRRARFEFGETPVVQRA